VVLVPGIVYSVQAPLLWFAGEVALAHGAGALRLLDTPPDGADPFEWIRECVDAALDFRPPERPVVVGKSLASAAAGLVTDRSLPAIWLTPLLDRGPVVDALLRAEAATLLVGGNADDTWRPDALGARPPTLEVVELEGLDHSLQAPGDPPRSLEALGEVVAIMDRFLSSVLGG